MTYAPPPNKTLPCTETDINDTPLWRTFLSIDLTAHEEAKALCEECPALTWCTQDTTAALKGIYGNGVHGTWAGNLYIDGRRATKNPSLGHCPVCGVGNGKPCKSARGKTISQPHLARRDGLPKCPECATEFNPSTVGRTRYCSETCSEIGKRQSHRRSNARRAKVAATSKNCIECGSLTGGTRCQRCSARRASRISFGREVA